MLVADWGTTSLRIYVLDEKGGIVAKRTSDKGILVAKALGFEKTFELEADALLDDQQILLGGMIGSRNGWVETEYVDCPATLEGIANRLGTVTWRSQSGISRTAKITPGVRFLGENGMSDIMRGEELQILGLMQQITDKHATIVLPGTHSKWVSVTNNTISTFRTYMTGEVFELLANQSILKSETKTEPFDNNVFLDGVKLGSTENSLTNLIFQARTQLINGKLQPSSSDSFLSGILIGNEISHEVRNQRLIHLISNAKLSKLYSMALQYFNIESVTHDEDIFTKSAFYLLDQNKAAQ
ncbi:MAG: 2-dehydro-3-deoxygalactonokinase [Betaproteobacteria bacterium]